MFGELPLVPQESFGGFSPTVLGELPAVSGGFVNEVCHEIFGPG